MHFQISHWRVKRAYWAHILLSGTETLANIEPKHIKMRILATTPPTGLLHSTTLNITAFLPVYNNVCMASPMNLVILRASIKKVLKFLKTRQLQGQTLQKRRLVACSCLSAGLEMSVLSIAQQYEILQNFQQKPSPENLATVMGVQATVFHRNRLKPWNRLLVLAFHAVTLLLTV
jgi:hypothetical protein